MKIAFYIGTHASDKFIVRLGVKLTRLVQKGPYGNVTHVEAIHKEYADGTVTIASSSIRDGGVRTKRVKLTRDNWIIVDVQQWDVFLSLQLFIIHLAILMTGAVL